MGPDACSRSQLNGKESDSAAGVDIGRASSVLVLGAVTSGYGARKEPGFLKVGRLMRRPVGAGKNSRF